MNLLDDLTKLRMIYIIYCCRVGILGFDESLFNLLWQRSNVIQFVTRYHIYGHFQLYQTVLLKIVSFYVATISHVASLHRVYNGVGTRLCFCYLFSNGYLKQLSMVSITSLSYNVQTRLGRGFNYHLQSQRTPCYKLRLRVPDNCPLGI